MNIPVRLRFPAGFMAALLMVSAIPAALPLSGMPMAIAAAGLAAQTSRGGGVEVKVTPRTLAPGAAVWEFEVTFDTHTVALAGDPAQFTVLVDSQGREQAALGWRGDPPGGHHRKGIVQFKPLPGQTAVELRIRGVAGVPARNFSWQQK